MKARYRLLLSDALTALAVVALLTCLAIGQIAAAVLIMLPLTFLFFGLGRNR